MTKITQQERNRREILAKLDELGGKLTAEEDIVFQGDKLIIPEKMTLKDSIKFLMEKEQEDERPMTFHRTFPYRPWDGARAFNNAMRRVFGSVMTKATESWFGEIPPKLITINVSPNDTEQIPWGRMQIPSLPGADFHLGGAPDPEYGAIFAINVEAPRKYRFKIEGIFRVVDEELKTNSLYRGKAFDGQDQPNFIDLGGVDPNKVIYSDETTLQLEANVWSLLRYSDRMETLGVPLKRAVLLEGPYGTGKTLAAYLTARVAAANGWTFLLCRPGRDDFFKVMGTARLYQPAVVFFEDVDAVADASQDHVRQLLDIFDGIQAKGTKIVCVLTTNHVDKIHKGMVRPGRLDAVIHVGALDTNGIRRLIQATVEESLIAVGDDEWDAIGESMQGFMPAFCREAIDRTVRYNVARNGGEVSKLEAADFIAAAHGLRPQLELMEGAKEGPDHDPMTKAMGKVVSDVLVENLKAVDINDSDYGWTFQKKEIA